MPCGKTNQADLLDKAYKDAYEKVGSAGVQALERGIRAKIHQKTSQVKGPVLLRRAFKHFDNDESGGIDPDEFHAALSAFGLQFTPDQILALYNNYDVNRDGELSYSEFVEHVMEGGTRAARDLLKRQGLIPTVQWVDKGIAADPKMKTFLSEEELDETQARAIFKKFDPNNIGTIDLRRLQELTNSLGLYMSTEEINISFLDLDTNGSGDIDWLEFWRWWQDIVRRKTPIKISPTKSGDSDRRPTDDRPSLSSRAGSLTSGSTVTPSLSAGQNATISRSLSSEVL